MRALVVLLVALLAEAVALDCESFTNCGDCACGIHGFRVNKLPVCGSGLQCTWLIESGRCRAMHDGDASVEDRITEVLPANWTETFEFDDNGGVSASDLFCPPEVMPGPIVAMACTNVCMLLIMAVAILSYMRFRRTHSVPDTGYFRAIVAQCIQPGERVLWEGGGRGKQPPLPLWKMAVVTIILFAPCYLPGTIWMLASAPTTTSAEDTVAGAYLVTILPAALLSLMLVVMFVSDPVWDVHQRLSFLVLTDRSVLQFSKLANSKRLTGATRYSLPAGSIRDVVVELGELRFDVVHGRVNKVVRLQQLGPDVAAAFNAVQAIAQGHSVPAPTTGVSVPIGSPDTDAAATAAQPSPAAPLTTDTAADNFTNPAAIRESPVKRERLGWDSDDDSVPATPPTSSRQGTAEPQVGRRVDAVTPIVTPSGDTSAHFGRRRSRSDAGGEGNSPSDIPALPPGLVSAVSTDAVAAAEAAEAAAQQAAIEAERDGQLQAAAAAAAATVNLSPQLPEEEEEGRVVHDNGHGSNDSVSESAPPVEPPANSITTTSDGDIQQQPDAS